MPKLKTALHMGRRAITGAVRFDLKLRVPEPAIPDPADAQLRERIRKAFFAMKTVEAPAWCRPSALWQRQLDTAFPLATRLDEYLANFGTWPIYNGIEETGYQARRFGKFWLGRKYVEEVFFRAPLNAWLNYGRPLYHISFPLFGNQVSAIYRNSVIGPGLLNDLIASKLYGLVKGINVPVIAEIGGGYGKLAYCTLRNLERFTYINFDLPETLCTAAYYLGKCFPEKRMLLYGEGDFSLDYDMVLMPPWEITKLPDRSADLFFNKNSLGEMSADTCRAYLAHIERTTRGHFFHLNHDAVRIGDGLLGSEYRPDMRLIYRVPDVSHALVGPKAQPDIFQYLYQANDQATDHATRTMSTLPLR